MPVAPAPVAASAAAVTARPAAMTRRLRSTARRKRSRCPHTRSGSKAGTPRGSGTEEPGAYLCRTHVEGADGPSDA
ncbi:hypothetical protein [Streptomyces sp. 8L]|uniref:hypothetical protein n=1 Tax=Streptomyces sp. 8L TaxID=2877242 RepID=UPI001CD3D320|nr:hypothetical protein [Streptomyces sp. 8L]MCA1218999.1 hypothetical protein [Streptomyces sp. 8L]